MGYYEDMLAKRAITAGAVQMAGSSGYFAARAPGLDLALFERGDHLRPDVRRLILSSLYGFWGQRYAYPQSWSTAWIAGSGITTAWNADRESGGAPGDLDVLIGVDYPAFFRNNPRFAGNPESALAHHFNQELYDGLWGHTARTSINGSVYELTFYVNPGATDIRDINPYAAYDVSNDSWTVHPVEVPAGFDESYFDANARAVVDHDLSQATGVMAEYNRALEGLRGLTQGSPAFVNASKALHDVVRRGAAIFDSVHDGRRAAFALSGKGYFDPANYRWQAGKGNGVVPAMRQLKQIDEYAHKDVGVICSDSDHLLLIAGLANGGGR